MTVPALAIQNLSLKLNDRAILAGVSLTVGHRESAAIVGESGCGKSTLLRCIAGIQHRWTGSVAAFGHDLSTRSRSAADRRLLQIVFQDTAAALNPAHTVDDILDEPLAIHRLGGKDARIRQALDAVGLPRAARFRFPGQLSGGQRQRLCIARALLVEPQILLLDEPSSALDVSVQAEILNLLTELRAARAMSFLLVSHDLAVAAHMCDRIAVMASGRIVNTVHRQQLSGSADAAYRQLLGEASGDV